MDYTNPTTNLTTQSQASDIHAMLDTLAAAESDPIVIDQTLRKIAAATQIGLKPIRQSFDAALKKLNLKPVDMGLAIAQEVLSKKYGDGLSLKLTKDGALYAYEKTHWVRMSDSKVRADLQEAAVKYKSQTDKSLYSIVSDAWGSLKDYLGNNQDALSLTVTPQPIINCLNGELWIGSDGMTELRPHKPESHLLYCLPYSYDPKAECPNFNTALQEIFSNAEKPDDMIRHAMEFFGYAIQPRRNIASFWMLIGHGANGKTSFLQTMCRLISDDYLYNVTISDFGRDKFSMSQLPGKLAMIDDDIKMDSVIHDGLLKTISESKILTARQPYGRQSFTFRNAALPIMAGNHYPLCNDLSQGLVRRAMVIPFRRQFLSHEQDASKFQHIWDNEMAGVLNLAIQGLQRVIMRGKFDPPQECVEARKEFLAHGNPLFCFLNECLEKKSDSRILLPEFRQAYEMWAKGQSMTRLVVLNKTLKRRLQSLGYEIGIYNGYACINGYGLSLGEK